MTEGLNIDRVIARAAAEALFPSQVEAGMDDPRSPAQIRRDAEKNGGNPRLPGLDRGIGYVANADTILTPVQEQE